MLYPILLTVCAASVFAQDPQPESTVAMEIADSPKAVDPSSLVNELVNRKFTVEFDEASFGDVVKWIEAEAKITVIVDERSLANARILKSEPVTDGLQDEPLFLLLDRLGSIDVAWWLQGNILHLAANDEPFVYTRQYGVGDLFDEKVDPNSLQNTIMDCIAPESWESGGGTSTIVLLGDVLFVRQSNRNHRRVAGLLEALRQHGRRTIVDDPAVHGEIRKKLQEPVTVSFQQEALIKVVNNLAEQTAIGVKLDTSWLKSAGIRERLPVNLEVSGQSLEVALNVLSSQYDLDWHLQDGALWVTSSERTEDALTAVFDVRDLCRNYDESSALEEAIASQACPNSWIMAGGDGAISFPLPGAMVVYQTERNMNEVLLLLENYRTALRVSKPRAKPGPDPNEVITRYYRMPKVVAVDLQIAMKDLIQPETWRSESNPESKGTIRLINSQAEGVHTSKSEGTTVMTPYAILVVTQIREVHEKIPTLLSRIMHGDERLNQRKGGGLGGSGGFGGGFFRVSETYLKR